MRYPTIEPPFKLNPIRVRREASIDSPVFRRNKWKTSKSRKARSSMNVCAVTPSFSSSETGKDFAFSIRFFLWFGCEWIESKCRRQAVRRVYQFIGGDRSNRLKNVMPPSFLSHGSPPLTKSGHVRTVSSLSPHRISSFVATGPLASQT